MEIKKTVSLPSNIQQAPARKVSATGIPIPAKSSRLTVFWKMSFCICSIFLSFLLYGVVQEKIMTTPYPLEPVTIESLVSEQDAIKSALEDQANLQGERFRWSSFLVLNNRIVTLWVAIFILTWKKQPRRPMAPLWNYLVISFTNRFVFFCLHAFFSSIAINAAVALPRFVSTKHCDTSAFLRRRF